MGEKVRRGEGHLALGTEASAHTGWVRRAGIAYQQLLPATRCGGPCGPICLRW